jgi:hypothetical protein
MEQRSGAMNSQSMVKGGDQPRMTQKDIASTRQPPSMNFNRNAFRSATPRNSQNRTTSR